MQRFAVLADIEAHDLVFMAHTQRHQQPMTLRMMKVIPPDQASVTPMPIELRDHLLRIAFEQAVHSARHFRAGRKCADGKHAREQGAGKSADAMHAEHVERVVIARL